MGFTEISSRYELGHIVELEVANILHGPQLIIFNLEDDVSARLHVSELSNNRILSQKLFNIVRVGESITSVIIGFNSEKQCVDLSLKPLRNQLEGSLSFTKCRKIVESRKAQRIGQAPDFLEENRNQLDRIQGDLAKVDLTFLYELIQNAIDHPNKEFHNLLSIKFEVYNDYLLLTHNGSIFTEDNFRALTGILLGEEATSEERIGYKGIGFKSIFRYTQEVYIRSGNFSFSFSKSRSGTKMPWEVIPIFENEIDKIEEIRNFEFFNTPVAFAFKFTNVQLKEQATKYLNQLVAKPQTLLFLENLARLEIVLNGHIKKINRSAEYFETYRRIILQLNDEKVEEWIVCEEKQTIEDPIIIKELKDENNPSIPLKFRHFRKPKIQIAFPVAPREDLVNMYAYLPLSGTSYGLPYIINGDFIPNLDRTDIIKNLSYNRSLGKLAAMVLKVLFRVVSKECGLQRAIALIPRFGDSATDFFEDLNHTFVEIQSDLLLYNSELKMVRLQDFVSDQSGIFKILEDNDIRYHPLFTDKYVLSEVNNEVVDQLVNKLGVGVFTLDHAVELLKQQNISRKYFAEFKDLLLLLFRFSRLPNSVDWRTKISEIEIVNQGDESLTLTELYWGVPKAFEDVFEAILGIKSLSPDFNDLLSRYPRLCEMLENFGLKKFDLSDILKQLVALSDSFKSENRAYIDRVWHFLYLNRDVINEDGSRLVNQRFSSFPIKTINGDIEFLENCFAGDNQVGKADFDFLHEHFGKEQLTKVELRGMSELSNTSNKNMLDFLKGIHDKIRITDKALFKRALKRIVAMSLEDLEDFKTEIVIQAFISVYYFYKKYPEDNLIAETIMQFPVLNNSGKLVRVSSTYLPDNYNELFNEEEVYAEKLFENIDEIDFLSPEYVTLFAKEDNSPVVEFLKLCNASPGIKYFKASAIRKGDRVNIRGIDDVYGPFNNGYSNPRCSDEFYIFKDIAKLGGAHSNLVTFWSRLSAVKPSNLITSDISCNGYSRPNPLLWLIKRTEGMFPMDNGTVKSFSNVHSKSLSPFLIRGEDELHPCFNENLSALLEKLNFKTTLTVEAVVQALLSLDKIPENRRESLVLEHFVQVTFSATDSERVKNDGYLIAQDNSVQRISQMIYLDKEFESSPLALEQTSYPKSRLFNTYNFNGKYVAKLKQLGLAVKGIDQIEMRAFKRKENKPRIDINQILIDFVTKQDGLNKSSSYFSESTFIECDELTLGLTDVDDFVSNVDNFYDRSNETYYFTSLRDLIDLLCEQFNWSSSIGRRLRKKFERFIDQNIVQKGGKRAKPESKFSEEEIDQVKKLFGRDLAESELEEENLYAQVKALRYFKDQSYDVSEAENLFEQNYANKYLSPIVDSDGQSLKVLCRSARRGVLFFGAYAWVSLQEDNTILYILTGDKSTDCHVLTSPNELENSLQSYYKVIRRRNTGTEDIQNLVEGETDLGSLQFLYKVKSGEFDIIFNPQQNVSGETEGPLVDIGEDI